MGNNFALIRMLAAIQIALHHAVEHMGVQNELLSRALTVVPGVPVFFILSGYLVTTSLERSDLRSYAVSRLSRIYPGLWVCLVVTACVAAFVARIDPLWLLAQATIVQFYNPDSLRAFGVGVINGSVWTIPVILQFYVLLPLLNRLSTRRLLIAFVIAIVANQCFIAWRDAGMLTKLVHVTLIPHLYMFMAGMLLHRNKDLVKRYVIGRLPTWAAMYAAIGITLYALGVNVFGNSLNPLSTIILAGLVIAAGHTRTISVIDISYGLYLYHMLVINIMIEVGYTSVVTAVVISAALGYASLQLVEKPALRWRHSRGAVNHAPTIGRSRAQGH